MKISTAVSFLIIGASQLVGAPLEVTHVAKEAKWLAHVDVEALRGSMLGAFAIARVKEEIKRNNESQVSIDVDMALAELKSITAYGSDIENPKAGDAVLVVETGEKLPVILDGLLAHESLSKDGEVNFELMEDKPYLTYLFADELYVSNPEEGILLASKRFDRIEAAYAVLKGEAENASMGENRLILNDDYGFFLIASIIGMNEMDKLPQQARILKKTTGAQISIGESGDAVKANLVLGAASPEVSEQLFRIVEGMLAIASFTELKDEALADMISGMDVQRNALSVSIDAQYPVLEFTKLLENAINEND